MSVKINEELLAQTFAGNATLIKKTMDLFIKTAPDMMNKISAALQAGDSAAVQLNAHSIKGSVGYFTKDEPYTTSFELEQMGRNGITDENKAEAEALAGKLSAELKEMMALMESY